MPPDLGHLHSPHRLVKHARSRRLRTTKSIQSDHDSHAAPHRLFHLSSQTKGESIPIRRPVRVAFSTDSSIVLSPRLKHCGSLPPPKIIGRSGHGCGTIRFLDNFRRTHPSIPSIHPSIHPLPIKLHLGSTDSDAETTQTTVKNEEKAVNPPASSPESAGTATQRPRGWYYYY